MRDFENCSTFLYQSRHCNHSLGCSQKSRIAGFADKDFIILIVLCAFHSLLSGLSIKRRFKTTDSSLPEDRHTEHRPPQTNRRANGPKDADLRYGASPSTSSFSQYHHSSNVSKSRVQINVMEEKEGLEKSQVFRSWGG